VEKLCDGANFTRRRISPTLTLSSSSSSSIGDVPTVLPANSIFEARAKKKVLMRSKVAFAKKKPPKEGLFSSSSPLLLYGRGRY